MSEQQQGTGSGNTFNPFAFVAEGTMHEFPLPFTDRQGTVKLLVNSGMVIVDSTSTTTRTTLPWQHYNAIPLVEMNFVLCGNMYQTHEGVLNRYTYQKGHHNILFNPYSLEQNELIGSGDYRMLGVHIDPQKMIALFTDYVPEMMPLAEKIAKGTPFVLQSPGQSFPAQMQYIFNTLWQCPEPAGLRKLYFESKLLHLLSLQCEALLPASTPVQQPLRLYAGDKERLYHARDILCNRLNDPPSLAQLSKLCGINEFKLKKGFRQLFQQTVFGFVNEQRLQQAQRMIMEGEKNISTIAYDLGYAHPQHFQRAFKKRFGITPGSVRR
jgi:AraC-like DNA-binding protein